MRNNSDREKLECLGTLLKVHQFVLEDKRDPLIVGPVLKRIKSLLQPIIDKSEEAPESTGIERRIIDKIIRETTNGTAKWEGGGNGMTCKIEGGDFYYLKVSNFFKANWKGVLLYLYNREAVSSSDGYKLPLTDDDKKFFFNFILNYNSIDTFLKKFE